MSQAGYTPIQLYYSTTASAAPVAGNLANGELAINITDGKLYYKDNTGTVKLLASNSSSTPVTSISFGSTGLTPATTTTGAVTVAGTLVVGNGGTGQSTYATGDLLYATSSSALGKLTIGANGYILQSNGTSPAWVAASTIVGGAGGSNTQVQYNSSGALAGSSSFVFDGTNVGIGTSSPTAMLHTAGSSSVAAFKTPNILEISTVSATAATGTINFDVTTQSVLYYTTNSSGNFTLNFRGSSGTSLNTIMSTGDTVTVTFLCTNGSTAYYNSAVTVDGVSVTPKWLGGTAPTSGNASAVDAYTYAIVKTGSAAFTVLASQTKFA